MNSILILKNLRQWPGLYFVPKRDFFWANIPLGGAPWGCKLGTFREVTRGENRVNRIGEFPRTGNRKTGIFNFSKGGDLEFYSGGKNRVARFGAKNISGRGQKIRGGIWGYGEKQGVERGNNNVERE